MPDDPLKKILDDAVRLSAERDAAERTKREELEEGTRTAAQQLRARVLPRLLAAQKAWEGKLQLEVSDNTETFAALGGSPRRFPSIAASVRQKEHASYAFASHYPGMASVLEGTGPNRGNSVYEFKVEKLEHLTDEKIDEVLRALVNKAMGLTTPR